MRVHAHEAAVIRRRMRAMQPDWAPINMSHADPHCMKCAEL